MLSFQKENGKRKPRQFFLIRLPFAHHANGSVSFIRLFTKKQTEVIRLQTDYKGLPIYAYNLTHLFGSLLTFAYNDISKDRSFCTDHEEYDEYFKIKRI
jgi:hypothetical protein